MRVEDELAVAGKLGLGPWEGDSKLRTALLEQPWLALRGKKIRFAASWRHCQIGLPRTKSPEIPLCASFRLAQARALHHQPRVVRPLPQCQACAGTAPFAQPSSVDIVDDVSDGHLGAFGGILFRVIVSGLTVTAWQLLCSLLSRPASRSCISVVASSTFQCTNLPE